MMWAAIVLILSIIVAFAVFVWLRHQHSKLLKGGNASKESQWLTERSKHKSLLTIVSSKNVEIIIKSLDGNVIHRQRGHITTKLPHGKYEINLNFPSGFKGKTVLELNEPKQLSFLAGLLRLTYLGKPSRANVRIELMDNPYGLKGKIERFIDKGTTEFALPTGTYRLELKSNGNYIPFSNTIEIKEGTISEIAAALQSPGYLEVQTSDSAKLYIDNQLFGEVGKVKGVRLAPGRHSVKILYPNGFEAKQSVEIKDANRTYLRIEMGKAVFKLSKNGAPNAKLELFLSSKTLTGRYKGEVNRDRPLSLDLPSGYYQFNASWPGHLSHKGSFTLRPNRSMEVELRLRPRRIRKSSQSKRTGKRSKG